MKKIIGLLGLTAMAGGLLLGLSGKEKAKEMKATEVETYIPMEESFFTNWDGNAGQFANADATYWDDNHHFMGLDRFFRGETNEGWQGTLTSRTWTQTTQYIYFTWGGANNINDAVRLVFHYGDKESSMLNDTFFENRMLLRYFKIPDDEYASLMTANPNGFSMHIDFVDYRGSDYAFHNFGYLHVNQTEESTSDAMRFYLNNLNRRWEEIDARKTILNHYFGNAYLKQVFFRNVADASDGFESNADFLNHWYFDWNYGNNGNLDLHFNTAIGFDSYRPDAPTNMPFNKTNNGFFRGWHENNDVPGFVNGDYATYRFLSRPFVVSGTGLVSIKMAGQASLHVIDTETRQELVWQDNLAVKTNGDQVNLATSDFNSCTMIRHVINLESYLGRSVQVAIADVKDNDWGAVYFDEFVSNYSSYPGFKVDNPVQTNNSGTFYLALRDRYVNSSLYNVESNPSGLRMVHEAGINKANDNAILNHADNSAAKAAYEYVSYYFDNFRTSGSFYSFCEVSDDTKSELVSRYSALSQDAQAIVDASEDFDRGDDRTGDWWTKAVRKQYNVGYVTQYIANRWNLVIDVKNNAQVAPSYSNLARVSENATSTTTLIVIVATVAVLSLTLLCIIKKRKLIAK